MAEVLTLTAENFENEVLKSSQTVLVDFWAVWCGPCRMMAPVVEEIAEERQDIRVGKVNVDEQMALAMKYKVASIPTLIVFKNGQIANQVIGVTPKAELLEMLG